MNVTFVGMPAAGKSTAAKYLAQDLGWNFIDIDAQIAQKAGRNSIAELIADIGEAAFMALEEQTILGLGDLSETVISTGGGIIYSDRAMRFLKSISKIYFLDIPLAVIEARLTAKPRTILRQGNRTIAEVYNERWPLYHRYADQIVKDD